MKADKSNFYGYNKRLQPFARKLRREMTRAEACLWKYALRARQMKGRQFRRQRPVLNYIADFMCKELKLIIEVDGITHDLEATALKDKRKTQALQSAGFVVLRFWDDDVLSNIQGVIQHIEHTIDELEAHPLAPPQAGVKTVRNSGGGRQNASMRIMEDLPGASVDRRTYPPLAGVSRRDGGGGTHESR